jgi:ATP-dependent Lon protease
MGHWENAGIPNDFRGLVRLFPLPNVVLFPHVVQALHIFEPRYCDMLTEALEADHLITMALLNSGWEHSYQGRPGLASTVCIGRIISHTPTDDGRHNILLAGLQRAKLVQEVEVGTSFRQAKVEVLEDVIPEEFLANSSEHRKTLLSLFRSVIPQDAAQSKAFTDLLTQQLPLGILTDIIGYAVNIPILVKQKLLAEVNVQVRFELLMQELGPIVPDEEVSGDSPTDVTLPGASFEPREFPPPFSIN